MTIYLDVLLLSNLWVDYFLLRAVSRMTHTPLKRSRALIASAIGACSALAIFLPAAPNIVVWCSRILTALFLCRIGFGKCPVLLLLRQWISLFIAASVFCGVIYTIGNRIAPGNIAQSNGIVYADVSLGVLLIGTVLSAAITTYTSKKRQLADTTRYRVEVHIGGKSITMPALCDSGNNLTDPFSGLSVVLCSAALLKDCLPNEQNTTKAVAAQRAFRMLPVNTVTGQKLLPAFLPDALFLCDHTRRYPLRAMIALTEESVPALFSPSMLP